MEKHPPFYGTDILRAQEQAYIEAILAKYRDMPASEELKIKIYNDLQEEKHLGKIKIPFKVVLRKDPSGKRAPYIEIILDTKV